MKLSEAIRLGAMLKPQGREALIAGGKSCAIGAALDAVGLFDCDSESAYTAAKLRFPLLVSSASHPLHNSGMPSRIQNVIWTLNDCHHWTREQIADWVETIERRADAESVRTETETAASAVRLVPQETNS